MRKNHFAAVLFVVLGGPLAPAQEDGKGQIVIAGRIVSVVHDGVPAAEVWVTDAEGRTLGRTVADGEGLYQLRHLPASVRQVHARGAGLVEGVRTVNAIGFVRSATLMLEEGDPLRGTVTRADGSPVAGAPVVVRAERSLEPPLDWRAETVTDAQGCWNVPVAPLRALVVRAWSPGLLLTDTIVPRHDGAAAKVVLAPGPEAPRRVRVTGMRAGQQVTVRCNATNGGRHLAPFLPAVLREAAVAADGTALLWPVPLFHEVEVVTSGCTSMPVLVPCTKDAASDLDFALVPLPPDLVAPRTRLTGQLVDELGQPLPGVRVLSRVDDRCTDPVPTGADGAFALDVPVRQRVLCQLGLVPGTWRLGDPRAELESDGVTWITVAADPAVPIKLHARRAATIRGTALSPSGVPIAAASVSVQRLDAQGKPARASSELTTASDSAGAIEVQGLPAGSYLVTVRGEGAMEGTVRVELTVGVATMERLSFPPVGEVNGVVRDAEGKPVAGAQLLLRAANLVRPGPGGRVGGPTKDVRALADRHGRYRIRGMPTGDWVVIQQRDVPARAAASAIFTVEAGQKITVDVEVVR